MGVTVARIVGDIIVKRLGPGLWELFRPLDYHVGERNSDEVIHIPEGTKTDFASVPPGFRNLFPKDGSYTPAAIIHDYLYETRGLRGRYTRAQCDRIFLEAMKVVGVGVVRRRLMYRAVRAGGWWAWRQHGKRDRLNVTDQIQTE